MSSVVSLLTGPLPSLRGSTIVHTNLEAEDDMHQLTKALEKAGLKHQGTDLGGLLQSALFQIHALDRELKQERALTKRLRTILRKLIET